MFRIPTTTASTLLCHPHNKKHTFTRSLFLVSTVAGPLLPPTPQNSCTCTHPAPSPTPTHRSYHVGRSWPSSPVDPNPLLPSSPSFSDVLNTVLDTPSTPTFKSLGVIRKEKPEDLRLMIQNYTAPSLAGALRDREDTLQLCAQLLTSGKIEELREVLSPHESQYIELRRRRRVHMDLTSGFGTSSLEMLRKYLARMPRQVTKAHR